MIYIEIPLWIVIVLLALLCLLSIHNMFGDFIAKLLYKYIKEKEKKDE